MEDQSREALREFARNLPAQAPARPNRVYFIAADEAGAIKIGMASHVWARMRDLQLANPLELTMLGFVWSEHPRVLERELHKRFADLRIRGEWFRSTDELRAFILEVRDCEPIAPPTIYGPEFPDDPMLGHLPVPRKPEIPPGVPAPAGNSRKARMERYRLARGLAA